MEIDLEFFASTTNVQRASRQWKSSGTTGLRNTHQARLTNVKHIHPYPNHVPRDLSGSNFGINP